MDISHAEMIDRLALYSQKFEPSSTAKKLVVLEEYLEKNYKLKHYKL